MSVTTKRRRSRRTASDANGAPALGGAGTEPAGDAASFTAASPAALTDEQPVRAALAEPEVTTAADALATIRADWRTPELTAEVHRAALAAIAHRRLAEARAEAAEQLTAALNTTPADVETAATAQTRLAALAAVEPQLDVPHLQRHLVDDTLAHAARDLTVTAAATSVLVPQYTREMSMYRGLPVAMRDRAEPPVRTPLDSDFERRYTRLIDEGSEWARLVRDVVLAQLQQATIDPVAWLRTAAAYLEQMAEIVADADAYNSAVALANLQRGRQPALVWQRPTGVALDDPGERRALFPNAVWLHHQAVSF